MLDIAYCQANHFPSSNSFSPPVVSLTHIQWTSIHNWNVLYCSTGLPTHIDFPNVLILLQSLRSGHVSSDKDRLDWFGENLQRRVFSGAIWGDSNLLAKAMGLQVNMDELIHFQRFLLPWKEMEMGEMEGACLGPHPWR